MGVIQRQASRNVFVYGFSIILGIINNLFVYPKYIIIYGFLQTILSFVRLISPISIWGLDSVMNKYHAYFKDSESKRFHSLIINWFAIAFSIFSVLYFITIFIIENFNIGEIKNLSLITSNFKLIWLFVFCFSLLRLAYVYQIIKKYVALSTFYYKTLLPKIAIPGLLIIGAIFNWSKEEYLIGFILSCFITFILTILIGSKVKITEKLKPLIDIPKLNRTELLNYGTFGIFNSFTSLLAFSIDILLVGILISEEAAGLYAVFLFLANTIRIPLDSISTMLLPIIGSFWKDKDFDKISDYYKRTGNGLFLLTTGIFLMIILSLDDILLIMGKSEFTLLANYIILSISASIIIDSITSVNTHIIVQSDKYRWNLVFTVFLGIMNLILTYYFIVYVFAPPYQAVGAAISTSFSIILVNLAKTVFVYKHYKTHPFQKKMVITIGLGIIAYFLINFLNFTVYPWINLFIINGLVAVLFFLPGVFLKVSKDINEIATKYLKMLNININLG
ncbi:lipopolysaccharide biosynthesis protein [Portibacter lacus]|uniref:Membrane protein involved in the export of O-antigen and teichoic acid n=1 Tax=Portibacter lacus TaxID=1099794 RepID=A0AA37SSQ3_9BACT|nr:polysaccharide biosynthesis C-terminal domain-containing protein [Portibacter lacus]GLR18844.1 hypothetical protein GCM10007940_34600 [Portibacter lacus]